jgi:hypothetical protein
MTAAALRHLLSLHSVPGADAQASATLFNIIHRG